MSYTIEQLWSEPVDVSKRIPIMLVMDDNLPLLARENEIIYSLADKARKSWNYYKENAVTETTLNLYQWLRFQLGCYFLSKLDSIYILYYNKQVSKRRFRICMDALNLLDSGRIVRWRLF